MNTAAEKVQRNEVESVVLLRGLAAVMVCIFHFTNGNKNLLPDGDTIKWTGYYGKWGVNVFFIISGFVLPYSMYAGRYSIAAFFTFLKKRIVRIEPPYIVSIALVLLLGYVSAVMPGYRGQPFTVNWWDVAGHLAYLNVFKGHWLCDVYWTLAIEFQYYLLIGICYWFVASQKMQYRLLFTSLFLSCYVWQLADTRFIFFFAAYFTLGIALFQYKMAIVSGNEFWITTIVSLLLIFYIDGRFLTVLSLFTVLTVLYIKKVPAFLKYLGLISYSLYLTHVPVGGRVINLIESSVHNIYAKKILVLVALAIAIFFAAVFFKLVEKRCKIWASAIRY